MTKALGETPTFDVRIGCSTVGRRVFLWEALRENTTFDVGRRDDAIYFRIFKLTEAVGERPTFDFRIIFPTFGRRVFL